MALSQRDINAAYIAVLGTPASKNAAVAASGGNDFAKLAQNLSFGEFPTNDEGFIDYLYTEYARRNADESGKSFWLETLNSIKDRDVVKQSFISSLASNPSSVDYQGLVTSNKAWLEGVYNNYLGRASDIGGIEFWNNALLSGQSRESVLTSMISAVASNPGSQDYEKLSNSNKAWLNSVYKNLLGRDADAGGMDFWNNAVLGGMSRATILESIVNSIKANNGQDNETFNAKINVADAVTNAFSGFSDKISAEDRSIALAKLKNLMDNTTKDTTVESVQAQIDEFVGMYQNVTDNRFTTSPYDVLRSDGNGTNYFSGTVDITNTANGTIQNTDSAEGSVRYKDVLQINVRSDATHKSLYLNDTMPRVANIEKLEINNASSNVYGSLDGANFKDSVTINGSGNVELSINNAAYDKLEITTGINTDSFVTVNSELGLYKGASGVDDIVVNGAIKNIETNANSDKVSIKSTATIKENANINLGADNDRVEIQNGAKIGAGVVVDAGAGTDTLVLNDADATNIKNLYGFEIISSNGGKISASAANGMNARLNDGSSLNIVASKDTTTLNIASIQASTLAEAYVNVLDLSRGVVELGGGANKTVNLSPDAINVVINRVSDKTSIIAEGKTNIQKISVPVGMPSIDIERRSDVISVLKAIYGDTLPEKMDAFVISNAIKSSIWNIRKNATSDFATSPDDVDMLVAVLDKALNANDSVKANRIDIGGGSGESGDVVSIASYNDFEDATSIVIGESTTIKGDLYDFDNTENSVTLTDIAGAVNVSSVSFADDKTINLKPTGDVVATISNATSAKAVLMLENNASIKAGSLKNIESLMINGVNTISEDDIINFKEISAINEKGDKLSLSNTTSLSLINLVNPADKDTQIDINASANVMLNPSDNIKENINANGSNILISGLDKQDSIVNVDGDREAMVNSLKSFRSGETYIVRGVNVVDSKSAAEFLSDESKVFTFLDNVKSGDSATFVFITSKTQAEQKSYIFDFKASSDASAAQADLSLKATINGVLAKLDPITGNLMLADNAQNIDDFVPIEPSTSVYTSIDASDNGTAATLELSQKAVAAKDGIIITGDEANPSWSQKAKSIVLNGNVDNNILVEFDSVNNSTNEQGEVKSMQFAGMSITNITDNLQGEHTLMLNSIETGIGYGDNTSGTIGKEYQKATLNINSASKITIKGFGGNNNQAGNALNADSSNNTIILDSHLGNMDFNLGAGDDTLVITKPWLSLNVAPRQGGTGNDTVILSANNSNAWVAKERTPINDFTNGVETLRVANINDKSYAYEGASSDVVTKLDLATLKNITYFEGNIELARRIGDDKYTSDISSVFEANATNINLSNIQSKASKLDENIDVVAKISLNVSGEAEYGKNGVISLSDKNAEVFETVILGDVNTPNAKNIIVNNLASGDMLSLSNITAFESVGAGEFVEVTYRNVIEANTATIFNWIGYTGDIAKAADVADEFRKGDITINGEKALLAVVNFDSTKTAIYSLDDTLGTQASIIEEDELNLIAVIDLGIKAGDEVLAKGDIVFS